mgnify:CR=1 FL=1
MMWLNPRKKSFWGYLKKLQRMIKNNGLFIIGLYHPWGKMLQKLLPTQYESNVLQEDQEMTGSPVVTFTSPASDVTVSNPTWTAGTKELVFQTAGSGSIVDAGRAPYIP